MKTDDPHPTPDPLNQLLREWSADAPFPPRFQEGVWQRSARAEAPPRYPLWMALRALLEAALARPSLAASCVAVLLLAGGVTGHHQGRQEARRLDQALGGRYVQSVDPYQLPRY